jgi:hypothetical protein
MTHWGPGPSSFAAAAAPPLTPPVLRRTAPLTEAQQQQNASMVAEVVNDALDDARITVERLPADLQHAQDVFDQLQREQMESFRQELRSLTDKAHNQVEQTLNYGQNQLAEVAENLNLPQQWTQSTGRPPNLRLPGDVNVLLGAHYKGMVSGTNPIQGTHNREMPTRAPIRRTSSDPVPSQSQQTNTNSLNRWFTDATRQDPMVVDTEEISPRTPLDSNRPIGLHVGVVRTLPPMHNSGGANRTPADTHNDVRNVDTGRGINPTSRINLEGQPPQRNNDDGNNPKGMPRATRPSPVDDPEWHTVEMVIFRNRRLPDGSTQVDLNVVNYKTDWLLQQGEEWQKPPPFNLEVPNKWGLPYRHMLVQKDITKPELQLFGKKLVAEQSQLKLTNHQSIQLTHIHKDGQEGRQVYTLAVTTETNQSAGQRPLTSTQGLEDHFQYQTRDSRWVPLVEAIVMVEKSPNFLPPKSTEGFHRTLQALYPDEFKQAIRKVQRQMYKYNLLAENMLTPNIYLADSVKAFVIGRVNITPTDSQCYFAVNQNINKLWSWPTDFLQRSGTNQDRTNRGAATRLAKEQLNLDIYPDEWHWLGIERAESSVNDCANWVHTIDCDSLPELKNKADMNGIKAMWLPLSKAAAMLRCTGTFRWASAGPFITDYLKAHHSDSWVAELYVRPAITKEAHRAFLDGPVSLPKRPRIVQGDEDLNKRGTPKPRRNSDSNLDLTREARLMCVSPPSWDGSPASFDFDEWDSQQIYREGAVPDPPQATRPSGHASVRGTPSPSPRPSGHIIDMDINPVPADRPPVHSKDRDISPLQLARPHGPASRPREMPSGSPTQPSQSMLQTLRRAMPERYNPTGDTTGRQAQIWFASMKRHFEVCDVTSDAHRVHLTGANMAGSAATWYQATMSKRPASTSLTFKEFKDIFLARYGPQSDPNRSALEQLRKGMINMTTYKTIPEYINAFEDTLAEAQLDVDDDTNDRTFDLVPTWFVEGFPHHLQRRVALGADERELKTLPDLIQRAREIYRQEERWPSKGTFPPPPPGGTLPPHLPQRPTPAIKALDIQPHHAQESVITHPAATTPGPDLNTSLVVPLLQYFASTQSHQPTSLTPPQPHRAIQEACENAQRQITQASTAYAPRPYDHRPPRPPRPQQGNRPPGPPPPAAAAAPRPPPPREEIAEADRHRIRERLKVIHLGCNPRAMLDGALVYHYMQVRMRVDDFCCCCFQPGHIDWLAGEAQPRCTAAPAPGTRFTKYRANYCQQGTHVAIVATSKEDTTPVYPCQWAQPPR